MGPALAMGVDIKSSILDGVTRPHARVIDQAVMEYAESHLRRGCISRDPLLTRRFFCAWAMHGLWREQARPVRAGDA